jgi:hypothetical protein
MKSLFRLLIPAALAAGLATAAAAQSDNAELMATVMSQLERLGADTTGIENLSNEQLGQLEAMLGNQQDDESTRRTKAESYIAENQ